MKIKTITIILTLIGALASYMENHVFFFSLLIIVGGFTVANILSTILHKEEKVDEKI